MLIIRLTALLIAALIGWLPVSLIAAESTSRQQAQAHSTTDLLRAVVGVKAKLSPDDPSAGDLGTEREGSGVVIGSDGLVLTIGYIMRRAELAEIIDADGKTVRAEVVATDDETGFGLLRAQRPLAAAPVRLGDASLLKEGSKVLIVSAGKQPDVTPARVFNRRSFAGYWEYLVDDAIFTTPVHQNFGGAALLGEDGSLMGIGSLFLNVADPVAMVPGNMFVPIDLLKPILANLVAKGDSGKPSRPWLGIRTKDSLGKVLVLSVTPGGPADKAGMHEGDIIVGVNGKRVTSMAEFFRKAWDLGGAGVVVPLDVYRAEGKSVEIERIAVPSANRNERYKTGRKQGL
jgi:S1-C subfamily serine protease